MGGLVSEGEAWRATAEDKQAEQKGPENSGAWSCDTATP